VVSSPPDARALERVLAAMGLRLSVGVEGPLALLRAPVGSALPDAPTRRAIVEAARAAGFASVSLELGDPGSGPVT
jgi:hypothetical protein